MAKSNEIVLVKSSDLQALYINGINEYEDYRIDLENGLTEIMKQGGSISSFKVFYIEDEKNFDIFPKTLTELKTQVKLSI